MSEKLQSFTIRWQKGVIKNHTKNYNKNFTFVSSFHIFSLAGDIIVYTPSQSKNRENYFNHTNHKGKRPTLAEMNTFTSITFLIHRISPIYRQKIYVPNPSERDIKEFTPAPTQ